MRQGAAVGFTLVELTVALLISSLVLLGLSGVVGQSLNTMDVVRDENNLRRALQQAMQRMVTAVERSRLLMVPLNDNPATLHNEADHTVLVVSLDPELDRDFDGFMDADNDEDGRVDEDWGGDITNDSVPGVHLVDDDNDLLVDVPAAFPKDDDEDGTPIVANFDEDWIDGLDNDGDGSVDEDPGADMNGDFAPGIAGVDDDGDGDIDEGNLTDDDEDGSSNEDGPDPVVFRVVDGDLVERLPDIGGHDGTNYSESVLMADIAAFQVERVELPQARHPLVRITLTGTLPDGTQQFIQRTVRLGSRL